MAQETVRLRLLERVTLKKEVDGKREVLANAWKTLRAIGEKPEADAPSMRPYDKSNITDAELMAYHRALQEEWDELSPVLDQVPEAIAAANKASAAVANVQKEIERSARAKVSGSDRFSGFDSKGQWKDDPRNGFNLLFHRAVTIGPQLLTILARGVQEGTVRSSEERTSIYTKLGEIPLKVFVHGDLTPDQVIPAVTGEINNLDMWENPIFQKDGWEIRKRPDGKGVTIPPWREYVLNFRQPPEQYRSNRPIATVDVVPGGYVELTFADDTIEEAVKYVDELRRAVQDYGEVMVRPEHAKTLEIPLQVQYLEKGSGPSESEEPAEPKSNDGRSKNKVRVWVICSNPDCGNAEGFNVWRNQVGNKCRECQSGTLQLAIETPTETVSDTNEPTDDTTTDAPVAETAAATPA